MSGLSSVHSRAIWRYIIRIKIERDQSALLNSVCYEQKSI